MQGRNVFKCRRYSVRHFVSRSRDINNCTLQNTTQAFLLQFDGENEAAFDKSTQCFPTAAVVDEKIQILEVQPTLQQLILLGD